MRDMHQRPTPLFRSVFNALTTGVLLAVCASASAQSELTPDVASPAADSQAETQATAQPEATPVPLDAASDAAAALSPDVPAETQVEPSAPQITNSKGLEESSLSNDRGHDQFKRPLLFAPADNGLEPDNPQLKWEMDPTGAKINMGGLKLSSTQIGLKIDVVKRSTSPNDIRESAKGSSSVVNFSFWWPTILAKSGTVTLESLDGKVTFSEAITEDSRMQWRRKRARYQTTLLKLHQDGQWGLTDLPAKALQPFRSGVPFRACLSKQASEIEKLKICTQGFSFQATAPGRTQVAPVKQAQNMGNVFLKNTGLGKTGLLNLPLGKEVSLKVVFAEGSVVEIASQPRALDLLDVVESKDGRELILTGRATQPLGKKKIIERPQSHFWAPSGIEQDTVWQIALPKEVPTIRILGTFNLPFTFLFRYQKLPTENDRLFVREAASTGTYSSTPEIYGYSSRTGAVESNETWAKKDDEHRFEWTFDAPNQGARNRSRISLLGPDHTKWVAHHDLYRGFPFEASARLSGLAGSGASGIQLIFLGEVAASAWAESLGFDNDLLSRQRWGVAARYFRTLTSIQSSQGVSVSDFSAVNADLKYNLFRGIWNRDELFGLIGSVEKLRSAVRTQA